MNPFSLDHRDAVDRRAFLRNSALVTGAAVLGVPTLLSPGRALAAPSRRPWSGSLTDVTTVMSWVKNVEWAGWWIADDQGFFAEAGIAAEFLGGGPNAPEPTQVLEAGQAQIGTASDTLKIIDAVTQGADLVMIGAVLQQSPLGMAWLDPEITEVGDLIGRRIGGSPDSPVNIDAMFAVNGLPNDYEFVPIGYDPSPLANGEVDAIVCYVTNQPVVLELQGLEPFSRTFSDFGTPLYADAIIAKRDYLDANRETVVGYLRAVVKGWEMNMTDPELGARLAVENYGVDLGLDMEQSVLENQAQIELQVSEVTEAKGLLWMDAEFMAGPVFEGVLASGRESVPDVDVLMDLSFLEEAFDGATTLLDAG